ncbi:putative defense protein 3 [Pyxicephalus adspersus]|uniref:putative defense protein 3 n=1 Tax=Pyxicephalus adspersus TaxID=30357 RepID=UPI003B5AA482
MMPGHVGINPQPKPAPYIIKTNASFFQKGRPIQVQILGAAYRGILLETRTFAQTTLFGKWLQPPNDTKILACPQNPVGAVTHANTNLKDETTTYVWMPPDSGSPTVLYFIATVAEAYDKYWLGIQSGILYKRSVEASGANEISYIPAIFTVMCFQFSKFLLS